MSTTTKSAIAAAASSPIFPTPAGVIAVAAIQRLFGRRIGQDLFLYSIARDPERDSPAILRDWAVWNGAGAGWSFLTGRPGDVETLRRSLGFGSDDPAEDANPAFSVGLVRYGSEPEMRWAHCQSQAKARVLARL